MKLITDGVLQVKVKDIIEHRNGTKSEVDKVASTSDKSYPVEINDFLYMENGMYVNDGKTHSMDIVAIIPATSPQGEPETFKLVQNATVTFTSMNKIYNDKSSRMIDLFAQGVEFVLSEDILYRLNSDNTFSWYFPSSKAWRDEENITEALFQPATIAENPEKPKKVVYNWVYKVRDQDFYCTTSGKFETADQVRTALTQKNLTFLEKIEHSREEV